MANWRYELYYGAAILKILKDTRCGGVKDFYDKDNSSFVAKDSIRKNGVYVKYCEKRLTPWTFTFAKGHIDKIKELKEKFGRVYVAFVCYNDGVCCLNYQDLARVINLDNFSKDKSVAISRKTGEKYTVSGPDGLLKYKIGGNDFPDKIFNPYYYEK